MEAKPGKATFKFNTLVFHFALQTLVSIAIVVLIAYGC